MTMRRARVDGIKPPRQRRGGQHSQDQPGLSRGADGRGRRPGHEIRRAVDGISPLIPNPARLDAGNAEAGASAHLCHRSRGACRSSSGGGGGSLLCPGAPRRLPSPALCGESTHRHDRTPLGWVLITTLPVRPDPDRYRRARHGLVEEGLSITAARDARELMSLS